MHLVCVNEGGPSSQIFFSDVPRTEVEIELGSQAVSALKRWQCRPGEVFTLTAADGFWRARLLTDVNETVRCLPFERIATTESPRRITIAQALPQRERFELVLEKATELGVGRIIPMVTERSSTQSERDRAQKKSHRWPHVVLRAARQCRRARVPELFVQSSLEAVLAYCADDLIVVLDEKEAALKLPSIQPAPGQGVALLVGPEGGFERSEIEQICARGGRPVSLGGRVLRTETAAMVGTALVQALWGDLL